MNSLLLTANAIRPGETHKTTEPRDPSLLPALTPAMGGLRSGDAASATPAASQATDAGSLDPPVGQPGWGRELGSRVLWLAKDNQQHAELRLNPPHLGPLEVRISLQPDQGASLSFLSSHSAVRDAVAGALPQLREMLADGGFNLLGVNVSHHSAGGESAWAAPRHGQGARAMTAQEGAAAADMESDGQRRSLPIQGVGLVDYFV
ncbi:MAG: flagellar hook-length control protein FliK [Porticoccaceae bacterium]